MVLATNEWLTNCENDQKPGATSANSTIGASVQPTEAITPNSTGTNSPPSATTPTTVTTLETTNESNIPSAVQIEDNQSKAQLRKAVITPATADTEETKILRKSFENDKILTYSIMKMMATKNTNTNEDKIDEEFKESDNNNLEAYINQSLSNTSINEIINSNASINSTPDSNTNTLQGQMVLRQSITTPSSTTTLGSSTLQQSTTNLSNPVTAQDLSSALQSVMNTVNTNSSTAAATLQSNYLNALNMGISPSQKLGSTFAALEPQTTMVAKAGTSSISGMGVGLDTTEDENNGQAKIVLLCETNSHPFQTRTIYLTPKIECKVGRLIAKSKASETNAIFDCKVLSRNHAVLWYTDDGRFWVKDTKSSNGTFINENKLGTEAAELHFGDIVKFGVDVLENTRKEVHGCIIACVKLYLPDGREAISIDAVTQRMPHSISFEELHRLNSYMQETSQREKVLKSKLFNLQNVLDSTRKNSALCWQSMITEDQLLHRIQCLEKKNQLMEKNLPKETLRNEVLKLIDDKSAYQQSAKEALRKVYQERCDAMQMLAKMETAYTTAEEECKLLRDQIVSAKQTLTEVNTRLISLEVEYTDYKDGMESQLKEAKAQQEQNHIQLTETLRQREAECEELKQKISELLAKRSDTDDEEMLEKQAIEKLDAAIADMDLGDDDDGDDEDELDDEKDVDETQLETERKKTAIDANDSNKDDDKKELKTKHTAALGDNRMEKLDNNSTMMKWLLNSDLNKKDDSFEILKAICHEYESDSSDEQDDVKCMPFMEINVGAGAAKRTKSPDIEKKRTQFTNILESVQNNLKKLEAEIESDTNSAANLDDVDSDDENELIERNGEGNDLKENKNYKLLKSSVDMLREAYNEIFDCMKVHKDQQKISELDTVETKAVTFIAQSPSAAISKKQIELQNAAKVTKRLLHGVETLKSVEETEDDTDAVISKFNDTKCVTLKDICSGAVELKPNTITNTTTNNQNEQNYANEIRKYQQQIEQLQEKLQMVENDSQNTLEIMQIECETTKCKLNELQKVNEKLHEEKQRIEQQSITTKEDSISISDISDKISSAESAEESTEYVDATKSPSVATDLQTEEFSDEILSEFEKEMREDFALINSNVFEQEEELVACKEFLNKLQLDNIELRHEIEELKLHGNNSVQELIKRFIPYGAAVIAVITYLLMKYY